MHMEMKLPWLDGFRYNMPGQSGINWDHSSEFSSGHNAFYAFKTSIIEETKRQISTAHIDELKASVLSLTEQVKLLTEQNEVLLEKIRKADERWGKF